MKAGPAPPLRAAVALAVASLAAVAGCDLVLGIPSKAYDAESVSRTCECPTLALQQSDFVSRCTEEMSGLVDDDVSDADRDALLSLAAAGCDDCANVSACYAAVTGADEALSACDASSDCASWACCGGELDLVYEVGTKRLQAVASGPASCCPEPSEGESACSSCGILLEDLRDGAQSEVPCVESLDLLITLAQCVSDASFDAKVGCAADCKVEDDDPGACLRCVLKAGLCGEETEACDADRSRPIYPSGSE